MAISIDDAKLRDMLKAVVVEVLEERRDFVKEIIEEAIEEVAMARAIDEGFATAPVSRDEVFSLLESPR